MHVLHPSPATLARQGMWLEPGHELLERSCHRTSSPTWLLPDVLKLFEEQTLDLCEVEATAQCRRNDGTCTIPRYWGDVRLK
jgi:hypothetical protein